jgi:hypothetical protein
VGERCFARFRFNGANEARAELAPLGGVDEVNGEGLVTLPGVAEGVDRLGIVQIAQDDQHARTVESHRSVAKSIGKKRPLIENADAERLEGLPKIASKEARDEAGLALAAPTTATGLMRRRPMSPIADPIQIARSCFESAVEATVIDAEVSMMTTIEVRLSVSYSLTKGRFVRAVIFQSIILIGSPDE